LLATVYCPSGAFTNCLRYSTNSVTVLSKTNALFTLHLGQSEISNLKSKIRRVALDPGHIGGEWAKFEDRCFTCGSGKPIEEASLNLSVARLLKTQLEAAGLTVFLTKDGLSPVTDKHPPDTRADIAARARLVNEFKPDLTVCIHFNATSSNRLVDDNRLSVFVHGNYLPAEIADDEQKFCLLSKLLERSHATELAVADAVSRSLARATGLRPLPPSENAAPITDNPYLLLRNLGANRQIHGPVIYLEPYFMNNRIVWQRLQLGDYDGEREIEHKRYRSIFREYTDAVADGVLGFSRR
jgi:N-acetylmuramoyl-L-alanine amidase